MRRRGRAKAALGAGIVATALALGACHPAKFGQGRNRGDRPVIVAERLDCPEEQGSLKRTIQAPDGRSCTYVGDDGETATLSYLALDGRSPEAALAPTEASLRALMPARADGASTGGAHTITTDLGNGAKISTSVSTSGDTDSDAEAHDAGAGGTDAKGGKHDHVAINLPGVHINADDGGASIHAFGQNITADDKGATVRGAFGGSTTTITADDGGAEIRSGFVGKQAVDLTYVLASDAPGPSGAHAAAYVARGPVGGPLVLASGTLKDGDRHVDKDRFDDLRDLVNRNVKRAPH